MKNENFTLNKLIKIIWKNIIVIILFAFVGGFTFFTIAKHKTSVTYSAERDIMIRNNLSNRAAYQRLRTELEMIPTYRDMLTSRQVMLNARKELPKNLQKRTSVEDVSNAISTNNHPNSLIISIKATTDNKSDSIAYVNSVAKAAKAELPKIQRGMGGIYLYPAATSKDIAVEVHSSVKKYTLVGVALGIIAGMVVAFTVTSIKEFN
ncbi:lipopolysaccharide biosynthesis protein [Limosilactobacillus reuteri]|uniref:Wzz/FepE/Etk N-terminal domain-containing protein n=1 Tax=Limosilactobacillus reuteri TaxID=1598 RepID=UPI001E562A88|nr:Wzz/FepE/Etk N-terminal domain-containing protein [Limosilactobacillus reuteri]MCC4399301.1 lipopolysaccharide biosynthesis protein [Limosilactobacillus reuteri]MCC4403440.1 lipopolysaccharide biosynthesis protein [Limosilactobacillus reuteri]